MEALLADLEGLQDWDALALQEIVLAGHVCSPHVFDCLPQQLRGHQLVWTKDSPDSMRPPQTVELPIGVDLGGESSRCGLHGHRRIWHRLCAQCALSSSVGGRGEVLAALGGACTGGRVGVRSRLSLERAWSSQGFGAPRPRSSWSGRFRWTRGAVVDSRRGAPATDVLWRTIEGFVYSSWWWHARAPLLIIALCVSTSPHALESSHVVTHHPENPDWFVGDTTEVMLSAAGILHTAGSRDPIAPTSSGSWKQRRPEWMLGRLCDGRDAPPGRIQVPWLARQRISTPAPFTANARARTALLNSSMSPAAFGTEAMNTPTAPRTFGAPCGDSNSSYRGGEPAVIFDRVSRTAVWRRCPKLWKASQIDAVDQRVVLPGQVRQRDLWERGVVQLLPERAHGWEGNRRAVVKRLRGCACFPAARRVTWR